MSFNELSSPIQDQPSPQKAFPKVKSKSFPLSFPVAASTFTQQCVLSKNWFLFQRKASLYGSSSHPQGFYPFKLFSQISKCHDCQIFGYVGRSIHNTGSWYLGNSSGVKGVKGEMTEVCVPRTLVSQVQCPSCDSSLRRQRQRTLAIIWSAELRW